MVALATEGGVMSDEKREAPVVPPAEELPRQEVPGAEPVAREERPAGFWQPHGRQPRRRRLVQPTETTPVALGPPQRLLLLDTWKRSGLPAGDFAAMVGISKHTLYAWKKRFEAEG